MLTEREQIAIVPTKDAPGPTFVDATRGKIFSWRPEGAITSPALRFDAVVPVRRRSDCCCTPLQARASEIHVIPQLLLSGVNVEKS